MTESSRADPGPRIIVALDLPTPLRALALARTLEPALCRIKVGKELFTRGGPAVVEALTGDGFEVFLDLKFHDIPNTVAAACRAATDLGVWMLNVHALGGRRMLESARAAVGAGTGRAPLLVAVTVLTSLDEADLAGVGIQGPLDQAVLRLAALSRDAGLDGVVCSAREAPLLRRHLGSGFCLVTPGIRPSEIEDDQRRVATPAAALAAGSDYLVVGRPVTAAADPPGALAALVADLA